MLSMVAVTCLLVIASVPMPCEAFAPQSRHVLSSSTTRLCMFDWINDVFGDKSKKEQEARAQAEKAEQEAKAAEAQAAAGKAEEEARARKEDEEARARKQAEEDAAMVAKAKEEAEARFAKFEAEQKAAAEAEAAALKEKQAKEEANAAEKAEVEAAALKEKEAAEAAAKVEAEAAALKEKEAAEAAAKAEAEAAALKEKEAAEVAAKAEAEAAALEEKEAAEVAAKVEEAKAEAKAAAKQAAEVEAAAAAEKAANEEAEAAAVAAKVIAEAEASNEQQETSKQASIADGESFQEYIDNAIRNQSRVKCIVQWYNGGGGFGFIKPYRTEAEGEELVKSLREDRMEKTIDKKATTYSPGIFVHHSSIQAPGDDFFRKLYAMESVECEIGIDDRGRTVAQNVSGPGGSYVKSILKQESDKAKAEQE